MSYTPAYLKIVPKKLSHKIQQACAILENCTMCPRNCKVDRAQGEQGFCRTGASPCISSWNPHFGEESPLVGTHGSGTIFFAHCNLGCLFCQNWTISHGDDRHSISIDELSGIMLTLQEYGCHNINFVTPTHQVPMILQSLEIAIDKGLKIPLVYNCGGYESMETLKILDGVIDIYMPDFKYADSETAKNYSHAEDYPAVAKAAIKEMHRQVGDLVLDARGIAVRGLLLRHLVLPEGLAGTEEIAHFLADEISTATYTNIMAQYYPCYKAQDHPPLDRRLTKQEYGKAIKCAKDAGLTRLDKS